MKQIFCAISSVFLVVSTAGAQGQEQAPAQAPDEEEAAIPVDGALGDSFGNEPGGIHAGPLSIRMMLQTRYSQTWADKSTSPYVSSSDAGDSPAFPYTVLENHLATKGDGWTLNRFFLRLAADPNPRLGFKTILDFAELSNNPENVVKQAYGEVRPIPRRLEFTAGVFKVPFSILELDPIASYELASLGHADDLIKELGFGGRDFGAGVKVAPLKKRKWLQLYFGTYRGNMFDEHASPFGTLGGRAESKPVKHLRLGMSIAAKPKRADYDRPFKTSKSDLIPTMPPDPPVPLLTKRHMGAGKAFEVDATFDVSGFMLRGEAMMGDRVDLDTRYDARTWWAAWALVAYQFSVGPFDLLPAVRVEWLDADRQHASGGRKTLNGGITVLFSKDVRLLLDISHTAVGANSPLLDQPKPLPLPGQVINPNDGIPDPVIHPYMDLTSTVGVIQLQMLL